MPKHPCMEPGCPEWATYRGRCQAHARSRERVTHHNKALYNSRKWQHTRRAYLHKQPLCERCECIATDVHHKRGVEADPWSMDGLEALCVSCHGKETRQAMRGAA